jgi:putative membrane protein
MLALTLLIAVLYGYGTVRVWRRVGFDHGVQLRQVICFAIAIVVLVGATIPPFDRICDALFSAHMSQHMLLTIVAPPFLVLGAPELAITWAIPRTPRVAVARWAMKEKRLRWPWAKIKSPFVATAIHGVIIWLWHAPQLYEGALANEGLHSLEHFSFVGSAALMWWSILHPVRSRRAGYAIGILMLFITTMHTGALGALFTLSHRVWYSSHLATTASYGMTPLEDQQLAGLIMWVAGGLLYVVAMSALFVAWLRATSRRRTVADQHSLHPGGKTSVPAMPW